jgi:hypothetical protein
MPRAILKFKLHEESEEFKIAHRGGDYYCQLSDIDNYCRGKIKYGEVSEEIESMLQEIRNMINIHLE